MDVEFFSIHDDGNSMAASSTRWSQPLFCDDLHDGCLQDDCLHDGYLHDDCLLDGFQLHALGDQSLHEG